MGGHIKGVDLIDAYRDPGLASRLFECARMRSLTAAERLGRVPVIMDVCGTHTAVISSAGVRTALSGYVEFRSGPGCPVCVTSAGDVDLAVQMARIPGVCVTTFGDMMRVPGSSTSLQEETAQGARVKVVSSPSSAVAYASAHPDVEVVFLGVGFETTAPVVALSIAEAKSKRIPNYTVLCLHKLMPPVLDVLVREPGVTLDGLLLPGHVCSITGRAVFDFLAREYRMPSVVAGFEVVDVLMATCWILHMIAERSPKVANVYRRVVRETGNQKAKDVIDKYFRPIDSAWRGFGLIPRSGLQIKEKYLRFDAMHRFTPDLPDSTDKPECHCGDVLRGRIRPSDCTAFGTVCTPVKPLGPCMVSQEGACAAHFRYGA